MMSPRLQRAPADFLSRAYARGDWLAVLIKSTTSRRAMQRVRSVEHLARPGFLAWLRAENAARAHVYVSVNAVVPTQRTRTRQAIAAIRHVFLDVDNDLPGVLAAMRCRPSVPPPSWVIHSSPGRGHVLWTVRGFTPAAAEALQRHLAQQLGTDRAATACSQLTRLPGFLNYKYHPPARAWAERTEVDRVYTPADFPMPPASTTEWRPFRRHAAMRAPARVERARRYMVRVRPAVAGQRGDVHTFRVCCRLTRGFALDDEDALAVLDEWNQQCVPPWSASDLRAKVRHARRYGREPVGGLLGPHRRE
jgi:RepB DNA-primase from phage plasmid